MLAEKVYDRVRERERADPDVVRPVLEALADPGAPVEVTDPMRVFAAELADQRRAAATAAFVAGSLTTAGVLGRVPQWTSRKTVAAARQRKQLLGLTVGRDTYHPGWQFAPGGVRAGVSRTVAPLLDAASGDAVLADQIMRARRDALGGDALADLLRAGRLDEIVAHLGRYREGYTE